MMVTPIPSAVAVAVVGAQVNPETDIADVNAHADAVSDMGAGSDAADMSAGADIAVIGMTAGPDGPGLTTSVHLGVGSSGGEQSEREDGRNQRFHDDFLRRAERESFRCPLTTHETAKRTPAARWILMSQRSQGRASEKPDRPSALVDGYRLGRRMPGKPRHGHDVAADGHHEFGTGAQPDFAHRQNMARRRPVYRRVG